MAKVIITIVALALTVGWAVSMFLMALAKDKHPLISISKQREVDKKLENWYAKIIKKIKKPKPEDPMDYGC